nr:ABC transporter permease [Bacillus subtilis]
MHHIVQFLQTNGGELLYKTYEHMTISLIAVILGVLVAVPLGGVLTRMKKGAGTIIGIVNIIQTLPSLTILAFFYPAPWCREGSATIVALFFYSVLPIYTGIRGVNKNLLESGKGIGMTPAEQVRLVELPLAAPVIMAGIRTSTIYLIGVDHACFLYRRRRIG